MANCVTKNSERLSPAVRPVHYTLLLHPDLKTGLFQGRVQIDIKLLERNENVKLNTHFLDIQNVKVLRQGNLMPVSKFYEDKDLEQLVIKFEDTVSAGDYQINIDFCGSLTKNIVGFYLSQLKDNRTMVANMIAIPDYVSGATEHWGLVTYRETQFLVDEATASATNKIGVANTIAHELAHMWFGNL
ncbi:Aminopeptidase N-9, partial [Operophtera brumata]